MTATDIMLIAIAAVVAILVVVTVARAARGDRVAQESRDSVAALERELSASHAAIDELKASLAQVSGQTVAADAAAQQRFDAILRQLATSTAETKSVRLEVSQQLVQATDKMDAIRRETAEQLSTIRTDTNAQLDRMRATVDEKLQKTLNERITQSFSLVNERLREVDQGLGEMKSLAQDVGGLKRVLSNVKARGIVGEVQLGAILDEILAPGQYDTNVATVPGSSERVEFAVKLPSDDGEVVYLPIDSKFPGDTYDHLRDAQEAGDAAAVEGAWKALEGRLRDEAHDIRTKYIAPPATTTFGIMFLPFEGLYAEVANRPGLIERLQREFSVNVAGPSTMAALLNSLQMGFQTVAIQKRAAEIQNVLAAVKTEFAKYQEVLMRAKKQLGTASKTIDSLAGTRSRAMERKLRSITMLDTLEEADSVLGIGPDENEDALEDLREAPLDGAGAASSAREDAGLGAGAVEEATESTE